MKTMYRRKLELINNYGSIIYKYKESTKMSPLTKLYYYQSQNLFPQVFFFSFSNYEISLLSLYISAFFIKFVFSKASRTNVHQDTILVILGNHIVAKFTFKYFDITPNFALGFVQLYIAYIMKLGVFQSLRERIGNHVPVVSLAFQLLFSVVYSLGSIAFCTLVI